MRYLLALFIFLSSSVMAQTLHVGLSTADYPPYYFVGKGNKLEGAAVAIAEDLADQLGYSLQYQRYPWKRVQQNLKTGQVDMVLVYFKTPERAPDVVYTDQPHVSEKASLFVSSKVAISFDGALDNLKGVQFFGVRGYFYGDQYAALPESKKGEVSDESELVRRIANPNLELIGVGNQPAIEFYARQQGLSGKLKFLTPAIFEGYNYFAFSRARPDAEMIAQQFSDALKSYMKTDRYRSVLQQYGLTVPGEG